MPNRWILFVKKWAAKKGMTYGCALSQPQLKIDYRKAYPTKPQEKFRQSVERGAMEDDDRNVAVSRVKDAVKKIENKIKKQSIHPADVKVGDILKLNPKTPHEKEMAETYGMFYKIYNKHDDKCLVKSVKGITGIISLKTVDRYFTKITEEEFENTTHLYENSRGIVKRLPLKTLFFELGRADSDHIKFIF